MRDVDRSVGAFVGLTEFFDKLGVFCVELSRGSVRVGGFLHVPSAILVDAYDAGVLAAFAGDLFVGEGVGGWGLDGWWLRGILCASWGTLSPLVLEGGHGLFEAFNFVLEFAVCWVFGGL